jgi:hypothetical protein
MSQKLNIYQKLNNFRVAVGAIRKDKTNPYHKSKYADINAVLAVITEPLSQAGLVDVDTTRIDENGNMYLITRIVNIDNPNEFIEIETPLLLKDKNNPQALGSALTYGRRYNRVTLLGLEQEDDDGNNAAGLRHNSTQKKEDEENIRSNFLKLLISENVPKNKWGDFAEWMKAVGYDISKTETKKELLKQHIKFKKMIREYLDELQAAESMGG